MRLKSVLVQGGIEGMTVYVEAGGYTHPYSPDIVKRYGDYHVNGLNIINGNVYIIADLFVQSRH